MAMEKNGLKVIEKYKDDEEVSLSFEVEMGVNFTLLWFLCLLSTILVTVFIYVKLSKGSRLSVNETGRGV